MSRTGAAPILLLLLSELLLTLSLAVSLQAWLTEIHEYAQQDVVLMLLGNKVSPAPWLRQSLLFLPTAPRWSCGQGSREGAGEVGVAHCRPPTSPQIALRCSCWQVDSAQDRVVKREDGEKLAKVRDASVCCSRISCYVL